MQDVVLRKPSLRGSVVTATLLLGACSPPMPDDEDLRSAMQSAIQEQLAATGKIGELAMGFAGVTAIRVTRAEKVSCKPDGERAAICEMVIEVSIDGDDEGLSGRLGLNGTRKDVETHRLVKTSDGWVLADPAAYGR